MPSNGGQPETRRASSRAQRGASRRRPRRVRTARCDPRPVPPSAARAATAGVSDRAVAARIGSGSFGGSRDSGRRGHAPLPELARSSVAASTASRNAARTPCALEHLQPGRGGAAGRRDRGAQRLGALARCRRAASRRRAASGGRAASAVAPRQADEHPGLDHRLGDEEHVGRPRAREPGDRVELRFRARAPRCPTAPSTRSASSRCESSACDAARRSRPRPCRRARRCWASPERPGARAPRPRASASVTPAAIESTSASRAATAAHASSAATTSPGFTDDHEHLGVGCRPRRARHHPHAGEAILEHVAAFGVDLGDARATRGSQPASSRPTASASPMRPPPRSATFIGSG